MRVHIKRVISYVIILVVVMPLPKIFNSNFDVQDIFNEIEFMKTKSLCNQKANISNLRINEGILDYSLT